MTTKRLKPEVRENLKKNFATTDADLDTAEEHAELIMVLDRERKEMVGGIGLRFWSANLSEEIGIIFPLDNFVEEEEGDE